jgi:hypothetical protein
VEIQANTDDFRLMVRGRLSVVDSLFGNSLFHAWHDPL